jgi:hypothetical protein
MKMIYSIIDKVKKNSGLTDEKCGKVKFRKEKTPENHRFCRGLIRFGIRFVIRIGLM